MRDTPLYPDQLWVAGVEVENKIITLGSNVPYELAKMGFEPGTRLEILVEAGESNLFRIRCRGELYFMDKELFNQLKLGEEENGI